MGLASSVLLVNCLLGDAEREGDQLPGGVGVAGPANRDGLDPVDLFAKFFDRPQRDDGVVGACGIREGEHEMVHAVNHS